MGDEELDVLLANALRKLRMEKGISQSQLARKLVVDRSTVAHWERGSRLPDAAMILRLADALGVDANYLFDLEAGNVEAPNVIIVDDNKVILSEGVYVLREVMPDARIEGFRRAQEAIEYAETTRVMLAVLDIELGAVSGIDLCHKLMEINPRTNILLLTAYADYSLEAWETGACGFILKPLTTEGLKKQLKKLRYPFWGGGDV